MTVAQLIKQLQKMPKTARVGISHGDNLDYEIAGWVYRTELHEKSEHQADIDNIIDKFDHEANDSHPKIWVTLHC